MRLVSGRFLNVLDEQEKRKVLLMGERAKDQLFGKQEDAIGKFVTISGISAQVVGVFAALSNDNAQQEEEKIYMPNDTLRDAFNQRGWVGNFIIVPKAGVDASVTEAEVIRYLNQRKKVDPNDKGVYGSFNLQTERDKVQGLFTGIDTFSWIVAIGTIMAGAIGVGNIMLIVVKERTREIGLRKALGATPFSIIMMIVQEALFITIVAGYSGLVIGTLLLEGISAAMGDGARFFKHPQVNFETAVAALIVLVISGVLASLLPASKAAGVNPIVALQDE
ncbi:MAG TPA: FtsX-like permease family protein, partial [Steroidobacteraceae bacterium]|nr:FtsX-like permease family protein [Steroidobacteraceae bacterium]